MRALLSVWEKAGLVPFAHRLTAMGWELLSTGGTARLLREHHIPVTEISEVTQFPELLEGRVKTLHPAIHAGILARRQQPHDLEELATHGFKPIDLVVVNLYPFDRAVTPDMPEDTALELIDIGGPALLRAAAKNFRWVIPLVDPADYEPILAQLEVGGPTAVSLTRRRELAAKAFAHVALYDARIAAYLNRAQFPDLFPLPLRKIQELRYGENPHQTAALYHIETLGTTPLNWTVKGGLELSYNNILDASTAWQLVNRFPQPAAAIIKHAAPSGVAIADSLPEAFTRAFEADPISAFGGIVALNRPIDVATAQVLVQHTFDVVIAPGVDEKSEAILRHRKALRLILAPPWEEPPLTLRSIGDTVLVQEPDRMENFSWQVVTRREPNANEWRDLRFAWQVVPFVYSNSVVLARESATVGIGGGQPNRVDAVRLALWRAGERARSAVLASDAFFPFPDSVEVAAQGGITAIIQPGGSRRDAEVIAAADKHGIAMVFTGERHFRH